MVQRNRQALARLSRLTHYLYLSHLPCSRTPSVGRSYPRRRVWRSIYNGARIRDVHAAIERRDRQSQVA